MQLPQGVLIGEFTKPENSTMPGLEMNPQEKKMLLKNILVMQDTYKEPAEFQMSKR